MNEGNINDNNREFSSPDELKEWLVDVKQVNRNMLGNAAETLFKRGFVTPFSLIGIPLQMLQNQEISDPLAMELSNKLKEQQQQQQEEPPMKVARTDQGRILKSIDGIPIVKPWEVPIPMLDDKNPPTFTSEPGWLEKVCKKIIFGLKEKDSGSGAVRVPPLCLARCSRGGKTRALYEIAEKLKELSPDTTVIFVTFNDFSAIEVNEQHDPVGALCRRIALAALKGRDFNISGLQYNTHLKEVGVGTEWVKTWLGETPCVLLIDELNQVKNLGTFGPKEESLSKVLKEVFLKQSGRYFVFSSHVVTTKYQLADYMETMSGRSVIINPLPLIKSLSTAVENLSSTLTARKAIFYGLVPALVYTGERGEIPLEKRDKVVKQWIKKNKKNISDDSIVLLLATLVTGAMSGVPEPLLQFMDVTDNGLVRWIPFHMVFIFGELIIAAGLKISAGMRRNLEKIVHLFYTFRDAKVESGDGWEALFVLTLLVRALTGQHHELMGITEIASGTQVKFDEPYKTTRSVLPIHQVKKLDAFLKGVQKKIDNGPQLSLYYPRHASFERYDCFLVEWNKKGQRSCIIGYQLKEGKGKPKDGPCQSISKSYLIRGAAGQEESEVRRWLVPTEEHLDRFFGDSGKQWTPKYWKTLLSATSK